MQLHDNRGFSFIELGSYFQLMEYKKLGWHWK